MASETARSKKESTFDPFREDEEILFYGENVHLQGRLHLHAERRPPPSQVAEMLAKSQNLDGSIPMFALTTL